MEQKLSSVKYGQKKKKHRKLRFNSYDKPIRHTKKQGHHFAEKCPFSQRYSFPSTDVRVRP